MIRSRVEEPQTVAVMGAVRDGAKDLPGQLSATDTAVIDPTTAMRKLMGWATKGGFAVLDQGLVTGSNFVIGIILARWLPPEQYGAYAVAFAAFLLVVMLYQSLLLEPLSVFGASAYQHCVRGYLKALLSLHLASALVMFFIFCAAAGVARALDQGNGLPGALMGVAVAAPLVLLFWLGRRMFYVQLSPAPAAGGALFYCALTLGGLFLVYRRGLLSPMWALLLMGFGGLGATALLFAYLRLKLPLGRDAPSLAEAWHRHWDYGRWAIAGAAMTWIPANIFYPLVSSFSGLAAAGELKALMNFGAPMFQTYAALGSLVLPYAARAQKNEGYAGTRALARRMMWLGVAGAVAYWGVLLVLKGPVFRLLYSGRYMEVAHLLPIVALGFVFWSAFFGPATALRAMESPASVFVAACVSSCISFAVGVPATWAWGVRGALWAMNLSDAVAFVLAMVLLRRKLRSASHGG